MVVLVVFGAGVLIVALAHIVIGWFLAKGLRRNALIVTDRPPDLGAYVRGVTDREITLESSSPRQDIGHPGTLGLLWEDGYGQVGEVRDVDGLRFTRPFLVLEGTLPPICDGELSDCWPIQIDPWAFPHDPADVDLDFETIRYDTALGPMDAWLLEAPLPERWAIHVHGWTAEKRELIRFLPVFHDAGFNSLVIDYRNDIGMPADPSGHHQFGLSEWEEVEAAVRFAADRGATEIVLHGCSTGGALAMRFLEVSSHATTVRGMVLDSPNIILAEAIRAAAADSRFTPLMIEFGMWIADLRWKIDWESSNLVQRAEQIIEVPTLVFHGTSDHTIPISVSRQLAARVPDLVELVETPAAGHVMSWNADPDRYERYLRGFLDRL
jgi:hypothetical protein